MTQGINDHLFSIQRRLLLCVTKCYDMVPIVVFTVLSGALPLDLFAGLDRNYVAFNQLEKRISPETMELWNNKLML